MKLVNSATRTRKPSSRCSVMPMDEASIAQACTPPVWKSRSARCSVTGSGVVRPVKWIWPLGSPMPSVPMTPQRRPSVARACAVHQAVEVLPLVPVVATTSICALGWSKKASAMGPVAALSCGSEAMRALSKAKASTPSCSTRQVAAPATRAERANCRPSVA